MHSVYGRLILIVSLPRRMPYSVQFLSPPSFLSWWSLWAFCNNLEFISLFILSFLNHCTRETRLVFPNRCSHIHSWLPRRCLSVALKDWTVYHRPPTFVLTSAQKRKHRDAHTCTSKSTSELDRLVRECSNSPIYYCYVPSDLHVWGVCTSCSSTGYDMANAPVLPLGCKPSTANICVH